MDSSLTPDDWAATSRSLRKLARSLMLQDADADDLAQSTVVTALTRPPRFASRPWFERVLRNRASDHRRDARTRRERDAEVPSSDHAPSTASIAEQLEIFRLLTDAMQSLAPKQSDAIFLRFFEGLTPKEIASHLDIPVSTVKTRLHRALTALRRQLERKRGDAWVTALLPICTLRPESTAPLTPVFTIGLFMSKRIATILTIVGIGLCSLFFAHSASIWPFDSGSTEKSRAEVVARTAEAHPLLATDENPITLDGHRPSAAGIENDRALIETVCAPRGKLRVKVLWSDGSQAGHVAMRIAPVYGRSTFEQRREVSDHDGFACFDDLLIGRYRLQSDRGGGEDVEITTATTTDSEFTIERNVDVEGVVVDANGVVIADATIWLTSKSTDWSGATAVTHSDNDGRFDLRSIPAEQSLGAVASNYAPSKLIDLQDVDLLSPPARIELVLNSPGGDLEGVIHSANDEPLPNALVCFGETTSHRQRVDLSEIEVWSPRTVRTDKEGYYRIVGLAPGNHSISISGPGHPIWRGSVKIQAGLSTQNDVLLVAGVTMSGTVTDMDGKAIAGVSVNAFDEAPRQDFIAMGLIYYKRVFGYPMAKTDAAGRYRLDRVDPGTVWMIALEGGRNMRAHLRAQQVFECAPGTELVWDAVLDPGNTIEGILLYQNGKSMGALMVAARNSKTGQIQHVGADREGRFRFTNLPSNSYTVSLLPQFLPKNAQPLVHQNVWPNGEELRLVATFDRRVKEKRGKVRGVFQDPAGRLAHRNALRAILVLADPKGGRYVEPEFDGTSFVFDPVAPGRLRAVILSGEEVIARTDWFDLAAGQDLDLGTIETEPGGSLQVHVTCAPGIDEAKPTLWLRPVDRTRSRRVPIEGKLITVSNLSAGEYTFECSGPSIVIQEGGFTVRAAERASIELELSPAADQRIFVHLPNGVGTGSLDLVLRDEAGNRVWERNVKHPAHMHGTIRSTVRLPIGRYSVTAKLGSGVGETLQFEVHRHGEVPDVVLRMQ